jgi:hypothetical protein
MTDLVRCRTPALGGSLYRCDECGTLDYAYHSCRNRHCPKCQNEREQAWLTALRERMLPCDHALLTFTVPAGLRACAEQHPEVVYSAILRAAAASVRTVAADRKWIGGVPGILAVLHTWTRTLDYHPHAHLVVTAGGLAPDRQSWVKPANERFLMPGYMLSAIFRGKMRAALTEAGLEAQIDPMVWEKRWSVNVQPIGRGDHALRYLARYVFHVALTNDRIERFADGQVTVRYRHSKTGETRRFTLPAPAFLGRFLKHVLPRRFTKVRYFGLLGAAARPKLEAARAILLEHAAAEAASPAASPAAAPPAAPPAAPEAEPESACDASRSGAQETPAVAPRVRACRQCNCGMLVLIGAIPRERGPP